MKAHFSHSGLPGPASMYRVTLLLPVFSNHHFGLLPWPFSMASLVSAGLSLSLEDGVHMGVYLLLNTVDAQPCLLTCERPGPEWLSYLSIATQADITETRFTSAHTNSKCSAPPMTLLGMAEDHLGSKTMPPLMNRAGHAGNSSD